VHVALSSRNQSDTSMNRLCYASRLQLCHLVLVVGGPPTAECLSGLNVALALSELEAIQSPYNVQAAAQEQFLMDGAFAQLTTADVQEQSGCNSLSETGAGSTVTSACAPRH
jgi:hypothetical protein